MASSATDGGKGGYGVAAVPGPEVEPSREPIDLDARARIQHLGRPPGRCERRPVAERSARIAGAHEAGNRRSKAVREADGLVVAAGRAKQFADARGIEVVEEERQVDEVGRADPAGERR